MNSATNNSSRLPLTVDEIIELESALMEVFRTVRVLKERTSAARHIKFPSLPAIFSESILIAATPLLFGTDWVGRYGGKQADVIVENLATKQALRAEVKATGRHAFQELKEKDLRANVLVWIRFGLRFETGTGPIEAVLIDNPGHFFPGQCRLDAGRFEATPGIREAQRTFRFENLTAMLSFNQPVSAVG